MVLAAGRGVRMRPLSDVLPKPALPLPEGPVVGSSLRLADAMGIQRVVANTWHLAEEMESAVGEVTLSGVGIAVSREHRLMGTAGGLALARDRGLLGDDGPVLVLNGDCVLDLDVEELLADHSRTDHSVTLGLLPHPDPGRWSRVKIDGNGRVTGISATGDLKSNDTGLLYTGVMVISRSALLRLPAEHGDIPERLWQPHLSEGRLGGTVMSGRWREIGTPNDYLAAALDHLPGRPVIHPTANIGELVKMSRALIGRRTFIGDSAVIDDSVIARGSRVGSGARVIRSVVLGPVEIAAGEEVIDEFRVAPIKNR